MQTRRYPFIDSYTTHSEPVWKFDEGAIQALDVADPFRALANGLCWFRELARRFLFQTIHDVELMLDREWLGREAIPSAGVINSQSVKAPHAKTWGYDASKKVVGRKMILDAIRKRWPWVRRLFADGAYETACN